MELKNVELVVLSKRNDTRKIAVFMSIGGVVANVSSQAAEKLRMRWDVRSNSVVVRGEIPLNLLKMCIER
jgi:hypothetical protein